MSGFSRRWSETRPDWSHSVRRSATPLFPANLRHETAIVDVLLLGLDFGKVNVRARSREASVIRGYERL